MYLYILSVQMPRSRLPLVIVPMETYNVTRNVRSRVYFSGLLSAVLDVSENSVAKRYAPPVTNQDIISMFWKGASGSQEDGHNECRGSSVIRPFPSRLFFFRFCSPCFLRSLGGHSRSSPDHEPEPAQPKAINNDGGGPLKLPLPRPQCPDARAVPLPSWLPPLHAQALVFRL